MNAFFAAHHQQQLEYVRMERVEAAPDLTVEWAGDSNNVFLPGTIIDQPPEIFWMCFKIVTLLTMTMIHPAITQ